MPQMACIQCKGQKLGREGYDIQEDIRNKSAANNRNKGKMSHSYRKRMQRLKRLHPEQFAPEKQKEPILEYRHDEVIDGILFPAELVEIAKAIKPLTTWEKIKRFFKRCRV